MPPSTQQMVEQQGLLDQIAQTLARSAPGQWRHVSAEFRTVGRHVELSTSVALAEGGSRPLPPSVQVVEMCVVLRRNMHSSGTGSWFTARFLVSPDGRMTNEFDYDTEPKWQNPPPPTAFGEELRAFPRPADRVPSWLHERAAGTPPPPPRGAGTVPPPGRPPAEPPPFRAARTFDRPGPDGRPTVQRPPVPPDLLPRMLDYLEHAPVVHSLDGLDTDLLAPERTEAVPLVFHTDGVWVWPGAVPYYLRQHRVPPDPGLVEHMVRRGFELPEVDAATEDAARAHLLRLRGGAPKPPAPAPPSSPSSPAPQGPAASVGEGHVEPAPRGPVAPPPGTAPPATSPPPVEPPSAAGPGAPSAEPEPEPAPPGPPPGLPARPQAEPPRPTPTPDPRVGGAPPDGPPATPEPPTVLTRPEAVEPAVEATQWIAPGQTPPPVATPPPPPPPPPTAVARADAPAPPARTPQWIEPGRRSERTRQLRRRVAPAPIGSAVLRELQRLLVVFDADPASYRLGATEDGTWSLLHEDDRWVVFRADGGERRDGAEFGDCEPAARYLLGAVLSDMAGAAETAPGAGEDGRVPADWPEEDPDPVR
ncbi:hypothetical protein [Streptoalloteichus hindustanus]|uniref:Uncharacterized protein n=1 Tax=Streptoalloteichus hindustanus TaxID=2017 RepID=A0A1M5KFC3_STRHI|nr:hypothetical protein [Streptoalloteichus hindustanus]SHG51310.1 hypothetical protein SAMN05444320_109249 [Streptoalloteichus hindustanus]